VEILEGYYFESHLLIRLSLDCLHQKDNFYG